jgi:hypothetical protein
MRGQFLLLATCVSASLGIGLATQGCGSSPNNTVIYESSPTDGLEGGASSGQSSSGTSGSSGASGGPCAGATDPITGTVGANGGSVSRLVFAVVGDTRPANSDDPGGYPSAVISKIYEEIEAQKPHPVLVIGTGDYQFSSTGSHATSSQQVGLYLDARGNYKGPFFPAMGNHECGLSGPFTTSDNNNCGPGNPGGVTPNYMAYVSQLLAPIAQTNPYYVIHVNAPDNAWTAKFVVTAANAWTDAQASWLDTTLAEKTTYTFIVRHQTSDATPPLPPGVAGVDAVVAKYPYTLMLCGHAHTYGHYRDTPQSVTIGNGGAPLSSKSYGYGLLSQRCDGAIVGDVYDYQSGATDSQFHFAISPAGKIVN